MNVIKRNGKKEEFNCNKIKEALNKAFASVNEKLPEDKYQLIIDNIINSINKEDIQIEDIQDKVEKSLFRLGYFNALKSYILYRNKHTEIREFAKRKQEFINKYVKSKNTANATIDDNSNVANKNIAVLNSELYKSNNIDVNRYRVMTKLQELYPDFDSKQYVRDLEKHIIYKNDENSTFGFPYCVSITMYPFILNGIRDLGGLSAAPKNLDSFCGMFINLIFAVSSQFAGACATPEALLFFDFYARKEWGDNYMQELDNLARCSTNNHKTIREQLHQYFQQIVYSLNQPAAARGYQSVFWNVSYFDKYFFDGVFENFVFPDGTKPNWESLNALQKEFMMWFNEERLKTIITFPVESFALIYKDGKFLDEENAKFVAEEYARGHSFFVYISDSADSLSSCCFGKDQKVLWKSSTQGVKLTTLEELHNTKWDPDKKNLRIFHNGSWVRGRSIKLPNREMYKVITFNNKEFLMTDNHINVTINGEKETKDLTTEDYLMFNTQKLSPVPEQNEGLTYEQGFVVGAFLGDGSFGSEINGTIYDINFSQNENKFEETLRNINIANQQLGHEGECRINGVYNNVYPLRISSKVLVNFIIKWTLWERGTYAHNKKLNLNCLLQSEEFRRGILDGWYNTDGGNSNRCYTTSKELAEDMEVLITSLGMQSIINVSDRTNEKLIIREEEFDRNYPLYCVRWYSEANHRANKDAEKSWIKKNNSIYFRIKSIEKINYSGDVYCIECNNEKEPYFTLPCGLITHNCRLRNKLQTREFSFTNGNIGVN